MPPFSHHHVSDANDTPDGQSVVTPVVLTGVVDRGTSHADNGATTNPNPNPATEESVRREKQRKHEYLVQARDRCFVHVDLEDSEGIDDTCPHSNNVVPIYDYHL